MTYNILQNCIHFHGTLKTSVIFDKLFTDRFGLEKTIVQRLNDRLDFSFKIKDKNNCL